MKFGIFDHLERRRDVPLDQQYRERLELVRQADRAGFYCYHVAEHHHSPLCLAPSQSVFLAAVAQNTEQLLFGPLVYVLPLHHPVRLLEEIGMMDHLSNGRFQIGIGRGTGGGQEFAMWGGDPTENDERFDETFKILMRGLTSDFLSFDGKYHRFRDLWMELQPMQKPHPPFWYAGNPVHAGEYGGNFICFGPIADLPSIVSRYRESWSKQQAENDPNLPHVEQPLYAARTSFYIADTDTAAVERAKTAYRAYSGNYAKPVPPGAGPQPRPAGPRNIYSPGQANFDTARKWERVVAGSPEKVLEYVQQYHAESTCNYLVASFQWGDLTHQEASRSMELFATEIMPRFADSAVTATAE